MPFSAAECEAIRQGAFPLYLTPNKTAPRSWFPKLQGQKALGLTAGEILKALLEAGCSLEDTNLEGRLHDLAIPAFLALKARKGTR